jgi:transposase/IS5 family transposase
MKSSRIKFKPYQQNQLMAIPPTFDEMIPQNHPVRVVNQIIEDINLDPLLKNYKSCGCSSYHPRMLLKVLVYGYLCNIYSSRKIEAAVKENIYFMWLAGMEQPDHNTINRFRTDRLKGAIKKIFSQVVLFMAEGGHVDLQNVYTDGTKIESNANRYTFVWGKRIKTSKERIAQQLEGLWKYTQELAKEELKDTTPTSFEQIDPEKVRQTINQIDQALKDKDIDKDIKQKINYAKKNWPDKLEQYEQQEKILKGRNSYSKTDPDATFMRMKEDHMRNGQLKPGYNAQISTNDQIIANYTIHQNPTDTKTLKPHLESFKNEYGFLPKELTADAGYGSEENYEYLEENEVEAFVKYNYFDKELRGKDKAKPIFHVDNLFYNIQQNCYYCPMGQCMNFIGNKIEATEAGYEKTISRYQAQNCNGCPVRGQCHKSKGNRIIEVSHRLNELKAKARERLLSEEGKIHRSKRPVDVEPVFGILKQNKGFRRFLLKGLDKVNIEFGLLAMAHNLKKLAKMLDSRPIFGLFLPIPQIIRIDNGFNKVHTNHFLLKL